MKTEFKTHINTHFSNLKEGKFILAISGGVDSVVLAHLCYDAGLDFDLAHCNFKLRGADSDADEEFVVNFAKAIDKKLHVISFNTIDYAVSNKVNIQIAARELRYTWFTKLMQENDIATLVTAHHADDNLETFLINLSRGTGIDGLTGIPAKTATISRPLLPFSRAQIVMYAKANTLQWVEDSSNSETKYLRNKIRHEIVPLLKELHPTFLENFKMTRGHLEDTAKIAAQHIASLKLRYFEPYNGGFRVAITNLTQLNPQKAYLHGFLKEYGFTAWTDIQKLLKGLSGKEIQSKTHRIIKDRDYLLLEALQTAEEISYSIFEGQTEVKIPFDMAIKVVDALEEKNKNILYVDKDALTYPLTVRKWKKGDYFYPFGMLGKKKLSKYFKDEKMAVFSKEKQWLLCSGNDIVWVIGRRMDRRFSVTETTNKIVKFSIHK